MNTTELEAANEGQHMSNATWYAVRTQTRLIRPATDIREREEMRDEDNKYILAPRVRAEIAVERDMKALGIEAICPMRVDFKRKGNDKRPRAYESPYLRGYIFAQIPSHLFSDAMQIKGIGSDLLMIQRNEVDPLLKFLGRAKVEREEAHCIQEGGDLAAIHGFKAGQAIELLGEALKGQIVTFKGIIKDAADLSARVEFTIDMLGGQVAGQCNLSDVRKAG